MKVILKQRKLFGFFLLFKKDRELQIRLHTGKTSQTLYFSIFLER